MKQDLTKVVQADVGGGLITLPNLLSLPLPASPNCMDVRFDIGPVVGKRAGASTLNSTVLTTSAATGFAPDSSGSLGASLQAFWKLNEETGARLDAFGTHTLTPTNTPGITAGILGNAPLFVASSIQYLSYPHTTDLIVSSGPWALSAWVNLTNKSNTFTVAGKWHNTDRGYWLTYNEGQDRFQLSVSSDGTTSTQLQDAVLGSPSTATWYLLNAWHDSAAQLIYLQVNTMTATSSAFVGGGYANTASFAIGATDTDATPSNLGNGAVDEVGFWKKILTAQERRDLWNGGVGNTYSPGASSSGFGSFDFGASATRWLVVAAGTGVYASSNRGVTFVIIATDRLANYQEFERSKNFLIATSETQNRVLYWAGSVGTFMLTQTMMPPVKHALDFNGFLLLMNNSGGNKRTVYYGPNDSITTDPFNDTFEIASSQDDEITGGIVYNTRAYVFTRYTVSQLSSVGGNPDFSVRQVKNWGAVPRTIKKVTFGETGEVIICLGWDKKVRIFDGSEDKIISTTIEHPNGLSSVWLDNIETANIHKCHAELDTDEQVYKLWVVMAPSTDITHCFCLNLRTGAWYPYLNQNVNTAVMAESGNSRVLVAVKRDGLVYQMDTGNTDAGTPITEHYESGYQPGTTVGTVRKEHEIALFFHPTSSGTLYYQDALNLSRTFGGARDRIVLDGTSTNTVIKKVIDLPVTDNLYRFRLTSSGSTANPWTLIRTELSNDPRGQGRA